MRDDEVRDDEMRDDEMRDDSSVTEKEDEVIEK